jgi:hypothetical protein
VASAAEAQPEKKQSRKEFIKQQEELWGAHDDIAEEDVPEGELTYEQYLAQRPDATAGGTYHVNGRAYDAASGKSMDRTTYRNNVAAVNEAEYYDEESKSPAAVEYKRNKDHEESLPTNEALNKAYAEIIRDKAEGEFLVEKDPRLKRLLDFGEEILALQNANLIGKKAKEELKTKKALYEDLFSMYQKTDADIDQRAFNYVHDKTYIHFDGSGDVPIEGAAYADGNKVKILDFVENPDSDLNAYTIERKDGSIEAVYAKDVEFKREFEQEKRSLFERAKNWFGKERQKIQEYGGSAYFGNIWNKAGNWLTSYGMTDEMTPEQVQSQKLKNRRNGLIGLAAGFGAAIIAQKTGTMLMSFDHTDMFNGFGAPSETAVPTSFGNGEAIPDNGTIAGIDNEMGYRDYGDVTPSFGQNGINPETSADLNISDPAYEISKGGGGLELFEKLNIDTQKWNDNAATLVQKFPQDFGYGDTGVEILKPGWLSPEARAFIETLKS